MCVYYNALFIFDFSFDNNFIYYKTNTMVTNAIITFHHLAKTYQLTCWGVLSLYGAPMAQRASYLALPVA